MNNPLKKEVRDTIVTFKVTKTERKAIEKQCKTLGVSVSAYVRYLLEKDMTK